MSSFPSPTSAQHRNSIQTPTTRGSVTPLIPPRESHEINLENGHHGDEVGKVGSVKIGNEVYDGLGEGAGMFSGSNGVTRVFEDEEMVVEGRGEDEEGAEDWRFGHGQPRSAYPRSALPSHSYYGTPVTGVIGRDLPKEIVRVERDWSGGEPCQFYTTFPMELEGRIEPLKFAVFMNELNDRLITAYSTRQAVIDNLIAIATWWTSLLWRRSHFEKVLSQVEDMIAVSNKELFNPRGLNVLSPRDVALQFLEIEYY